MLKKTAIFKSRLARRFFIMFISCALLPIIAIAGISYYRVTRQLKDQAFERLAQSAKAYALSIYERLLLADEHLQILQTLLHSESKNDLGTMPKEIIARSREFFTGVVWIHDDGHIDAWGERMPQKFVAAADTGGNHRITTWRNGLEWPSVTMTHGRKDALLIGHVDLDALWGLKNGNILGAGASFCVWDENGVPIFSSLPNAKKITDFVNDQIATMSAGKAEFALQRQTYLSAYWPLFFKPRFGTSHWTIMVLESKDHVFQPLHSFQALFPYILLLSLIIVIGLSSWAIRRSLVPIESLMEGARQVSQRCFSYRVNVTSRDEFHDLANVFNQMTAQLDDQFKFFKASADLDRAILSVLDIDQLVTDSLKHMTALFAFQISAIFLLESQNPVERRSYFYDSRHGTRNPQLAPFCLSVHEAVLFDQGRAWIDFEVESDLPDFLRAFKQPCIKCVYIFPMYVRGHLYALFGYGATSRNDQEDMALKRIRRFVNHLAVAFANSSLVQELKDLNLGTLYALARTVDAKSPWTAGHSSRVTQLAINIATAMDLPQTDLDNLRRASLLHDIGKIAIPIAILDKNNQLSTDEYAMIKNHPAIGARILAPIHAYADIIPIVEQHHERFDGKGYPFGLSGEQIHLSARILALADAYDAMVSDRPYRKGLSKEKALEIIAQETGKQFDPVIVAAFGQAIIPMESSIPSPHHQWTPDQHPLSDHWNDKHPATPIESVIPRKNSLYEKYNG